MIPRTSTLTKIDVGFRQSEDVLALLSCTYGDVAKSTLSADSVRTKRSPGLVGFTNKWLGMW